MKYIKRLILVLVIAVLGSPPVWADDFDPASPADPGLPVLYRTLTLVAEPTDGGSQSGGGRYPIGALASVNAYAATNYTFECWKSKKTGTVISNERFFSYQMGQKNDTLVACYSFTPNAPDDPNATLHHRLVLIAGTGISSVSGGGRYSVGTSVRIRAYIEKDFEFIGWKNNRGEIISQSLAATFSMPNHVDTLYAFARFSPDSPTDPSAPAITHRVNVTCSEGGYWQGTSGKLAEEASGQLKATTNPDYVFEGWYLNGDFYTSVPNFSFTMEKIDMNFYAKFKFVPASPVEPNMPALDQYTFYLPTVNTVSGRTIRYPIHLVNTLEVHDVTIRLTFPAAFQPNIDAFELSPNATGYSVSLAEVEDDISIIEEGARLWQFSLIGGTITAGTTSLLTFSVPISSDIPVGESHQVKINQVSMAMPDGTPVTARTRNGRIGVYEWGDANGDGAVTVTDIVTAIAHMQGKTPTTFIEEVTDVNKDGTITVDDCSGIETIVLNK